MTDSNTSKSALGNSHASMLQKAMMKALSLPKTPPQPLDPSNPAFANAAVSRCAHAHASVIQAAVSQGRERWQYSGDAKAAYCNAMPPLSGSRNIRDFIACTAHAMLIDAIDGREGARLLYAAQVAYSAHNAQSRKKNKSRAKTAPKSRENGHISHSVSSATLVK
jgi:hypothetical protein